MIGLVVLLLAGCGGASAAPSDPWGLSALELPRTVEQIAAVYDSMPAEIAGFPRVGELGGEHLVDYGGENSGGPSMWNQGGDHRVVDGEQLPPGQFLTWAAGSEDLGLDIIDRGLEGDVVWLYVATPGADESGEFTEYMVVCGDAAGDYLFFFNARSPADLDALIEAFVATVEA